MLYVPLLERGSIDLHNGVLHQCLRAHKLVVRSIIHNVDYFRLVGNTLRTPGEVTLVQAQSSEFVVATADTDRADAYIILLLSQLRVAGGYLCYLY